MSLSELPDDIIKHVMSFVNNEGENYMSILLTCKRWNGIALFAFSYTDLALRYAVSKGNTEVPIPTTAIECTSGFLSYFVTNRSILPLLTISVCF
jgi:hypothetical protein